MVRFHWHVEVRPCKAIQVSMELDLCAQATRTFRTAMVAVISTSMLAFSTLHRRAMPCTPLVRPSATLAMTSRFHSILCPNHAMHCFMKPGCMQDNCAAFIPVQGAVITPTGLQHMLVEMEVPGMTATVTGMLTMPHNAHLAATRSVGIVLAHDINAETWQDKLITSLAQVRCCLPACLLVCSLTRSSVWALCGLRFRRAGTCHDMSTWLVCLLLCMHVA